LDPRATARKVELAMLRLKSGQLLAMAGAHRAGFVARLNAENRRRFTAWAAALRNAEASLAWTDAAVADALAAGFRHQQDVRRYVDFAVLYGRRFAERQDCAWAAAALARRDLTNELRLELLDIGERNAVPREVLWRG
jgi:hypothetical protein